MTQDETHTGADDRAGREAGAKAPGPSPKELVAILNANLSGFDKRLGLRFTAAGPEKFRAELTVDESHKQPYGLVHGGVYAAMIETVCSTGAAISVLERGRSAVGLENSTSFLKAVRSGRLVCEAVPLVQGRNSQVWEGVVRDDRGRLVAKGRVRLLTPESRVQADGAPLTLQTGGPEFPE